MKIKILNEEKKIIADYMGWGMHQVFDCYCRHCEYQDAVVNFDLNDAGLVVKEMVKRGDWEHDFMDFVAGSQKWNYHQCIAWLFDAKNFFKAFVKWRNDANKNT